MPGKTRLVPTLCLILILGYAFCVALPPIWDDDTFWHLRVGEWILAHHTVPTTDTLSCLTPQRPWRSFNWLFQVMAIAAEHRGGLLNVRLLTALVVLAGYLLWFAFFTQVTRSTATALCLLLLLVLLFDDRIRVRPHVFNLAAEGALLWFFAEGARLRGWPQRILYLGLFVLWANLHHPAAALGAGLLGAALALRVGTHARLGEDWGTAAREAAWPVGLALLALCLNPYGPGLVLSAQQTITPTRSSIGEWQPTLIYLEGPPIAHHLIAGALPYLMLIAVCALLLHKVRRHEFFAPAQLRWLGDAGLSLGYLALSLTAMRFVYLAVAPLALLLGRLHLSRARVPALLAGALFLSASVQYSVVMHAGGLPEFFHRIGQDVPERHFPELGADLIRGAELRGKVFAPAMWGGYLLWFARPPLGVAFDGRQAADPALYRLSLDIEQAHTRDGARLSADLLALGVDLAVLPSRSFPFDEWPKEWVRVAHDERVEVFLRAGAEDTARVSRFVGQRPDETLEQAATRFFGVRYLAAQKDWLIDLASVSNPEAVHRIAEVQRLAGHDEAALGLLRQHLSERPECWHARVQIAHILHGQGRYDEARQVLLPAAQGRLVPARVSVWLEHLDHVHPGNEGKTLIVH